MPIPTGGPYSNGTMLGDGSGENYTTTTTGAAGGPSPTNDAEDGASLFGEDTMTGDVAEY